MRLKPVSHGDGSPYGVRWDCPGCKEPHVVPTHGPNAWGFNGDFDRPTLSPSILVHPAPHLAEDGSAYQTPRCHSFIRDGRIEFCGDSEHQFAGQTLDLSEIVDSV
jgi:hypothetical protein